jgi:uridylate kinase
MIKIPTVISLGGSLVVPGEIDVNFLIEFKRLILKKVNLGEKFILVVGGGKTARKYITALKSVSKVGNKDLDWMGIQASWINAKLVQLNFGKNAYPEIISDPNKKVDFKESILVAGGWKPGRSTDDCAVRLAKTYGAKIIINLSNIDYVYNKDPKKYKDAKKIELISWKEFRKITGNKWIPGKNLPFDPTAAKTAQENKVKVIITNFKNLNGILSNRSFKGTVVQ